MAVQVFNMLIVVTKNLQHNEGQTCYRVRGFNWRRLTACLIGVTAKVLY